GCVKGRLVLRRERVGHSQRARRGQFQNTAPICRIQGTCEVEGAVTCGNVNISTAIRGRSSSTHPYPGGAAVPRRVEYGSDGKRLRIVRDDPTMIRGIVAV